MTFAEENVIALHARSEIGMGEELVTVRGAVIATNGNEFGLWDKEESLLGGGEEGRVGELGEDVLDGVDGRDLGECGVGC